jgi:hypothetical protein
METTLEAAIRARADLRERYRGEPWLRGAGVGLSELGFGLELRPPGPVRPYPDVYTPVPMRVVVSGAFAPLSCARWRWNGRPELFDPLDLDHDERVDELELERGLGRGAALLRGEASGPLDVHAWEGSPRLFHALDTDRDGLVTRRELEEGLGPRALRLLHGQPAHGPLVPAGSAHGWRAHARWVSFKDREAKAKYMADAAREDAHDPVVISWARQFRGLPLEARAAAILYFVQRCIEYQRDPAWYDRAGTRHGIELLDSSAVGFARGYGDCDLKARMFVALCLASCLRAEIDPVFTGKTGFPHVRARVVTENAETGGESWETADPTITNSTIGHLPAHAQTAFPPERS